MEKLKLSLHIPAYPEQLLRLREAGMLSEAQWQAALDTLHDAPERSDWQNFIETLLLSLGSLLLLAGILFFFAYNWAELDKFAKLGLLQAGIVLTCGFSLWRGLEQLSAQVSLLGAAVLTGVLLAVFGQIYQTGADAYSLFVSWTLLILPWTLLSRFVFLWLLNLALANLGLFLYWEQAIRSEESLLALLVCVLNLSFWLLWEIFHPSRPWLRQIWLRPLLLIASLGTLALPTWAWVTSNHFDDTWQIVAVCAYALGSAFVLWYYQFQRHDLAVLAFTLAGLIATFSLFLMDNLISWDAEWNWLFMGLLVIAQAALATRWLQHKLSQWRKEGRV